MCSGQQKLATALEFFQNNRSVGFKLIGDYIQCVIYGAAPVWGLDKVLREIGRIERTLFRGPLGKGKINHAKTTFQPIGPYLSLELRDYCVSASEIERLRTPCSRSVRK